VARGNWCGQDLEHSIASLAHKISRSKGKLPVGFIIFAKILLFDLFDDILFPIKQLRRGKMTKGGIYLTPDGYEKLRKELEFLKTEKRRQLSKAIGEARSHGDISENAEYDAAKDAQGMNEKKIAELEGKLATAKILDDSEMSKDEILIGATVKLKDVDSGEEIEYTLVSEEEADYAANKISVTSPVGSGLLNHKVKDVVEIKVPAGVLKYKVVKISR